MPFNIFARANKHALNEFIFISLVFLLNTLLKLL